MSEPAQLRVPREHGAVVAVPPMSEVSRLLEINSRRLKQLGTRQDLRTEARKETVVAARYYLACLDEPLPDRGSDFIVAAGHQPELFHPGVWLKNFALNGVARAHSATPLNLIVDTDGIKSPSLAVPRVHLPLPPIDEFRPHTESVAFDGISSGVPYAEWHVRDEKLFDTLPDRVRGDWPFEPLLPTFWDEARKIAARTTSMTDRLTGARRALERRWGCHNIELPVSRFRKSFVHFACDLLGNLPRFHAIYNECLHDYRRRHGLRSRNHPAPDLARDGDWLETPFWAWRKGDQRRARVYSRLTGDGGIYLRVFDTEWPLGTVGMRPSRIERVVAHLERAGLMLRSRALTTTLFIRLFVADLFIHGIGGARYDEVTDGIIRRYYGVEPPEYLVLTGTLQLPLPSYPTSTADCRRLARLARDMDYNPQRHLDDRRSPHELLARRDSLVSATPSDLPEKRRRWRALQEATAALQPFVAEKRAHVLADLEKCRREVEANAVLRNREYAFCLYPEEIIRPFCTKLLDDSGEPGA